MVSVSRAITSTIFILIGIVLLFVSFLVKETLLATLFWGIIFLILGLYMIFNDKEDRIESRKDLNKKKIKK